MAKKTIVTDGIWFPDGTFQESAAVSGSYTGTAERTVGGITEDDVFTAATMQEMWDALLLEEKNPVLTPPSSTFTASITGLREVGSLVDITFNSAFNRGSINPQYTSDSPFRAGEPNEYQFTGTGLTNQSKTDLTDSQTVLAYIVLINGQSWQGRVAYDAGVQPKTSYGNDYESPLAAGVTSYITRTITGVYPFFATTTVINAYEKQALASHTANYYEVGMVAETGDGNKQTIQLAEVKGTVTGIQFFNTVSSTWEWLGGSKIDSLITFTLTTLDININGTDVPYRQYTHNGVTTGARLLRFWRT